MTISERLLRALGRRELERGPCYPKMRAEAERVNGDLSLPGEQPFVPLMERLTPEQHEYFRAEMALIWQRFEARFAKRTGADRTDTGNWPRLGAPFDEYDSEGRLYHYEDAEAVRNRYEQQRIWTGHA